LTAPDARPNVADVERRIICISRTLGAGGEEVGRLVAERLGFGYVDDEIIARAAAAGGVGPAEIADAERHKSFLRRLLAELGEGRGAEIYAGGLGSPVVGREPRQDPVGLILQAIEETSSGGDVVIVAHAASYALTGRADLLRVLITASPETRTARIAEADRLETKAAAKAIRVSDSDRADYLRRFYEIDAELPTHYDLVVSTDVLSAEEAAAIVVSAAAHG
jgi:Cytidylate kinase-like family